MSTKIYNGYILNGLSSMGDVHKFCMKLKDRVKPLANRLYTKYFVEQMIRSYDDNQFGIFDPTHYFISNDSNDLFWGVERYIRARIDEIKRTGERDPEVDFSFTIILLPNKKNTQVLLYAERKELVRAFSKMPEVSDYHYQNQCDKPRNVTNKLWDKRSDDWDFVLGGDGYATPAESGFEYTPYNVDRLSMRGMSKTDRSKLKKFVPSMEVRAERIARYLMGQEYDLANPVPPADDSKHDHRMDRYWKFLEYMKSDEGKKIMKEKMTKIIPELKVFKEYTDFNIKLTLHENVQTILNSEHKGKPYWYTGRL